MGRHHDFYREHRTQYKQIEKNLETVNKKFRSGDREQQRRMLLDSYIFGVLSVQTPVPIHESAFRQIKNGEDLENAMSSVNYWRNKSAYIRETEVKFEEIDCAIELLLNDKVDAAHRHVADHFKGVSTVKAAFTIAMLGFTEKACTDTNVLTAADMDREDAYTGVVIEKYNKFVESSFDMIDPKLYKAAPSTFINQWVIFDSIRGEVSMHKVFFENVGDMTAPNPL